MAELVSKTFTVNLQRDGLSQPWGLRLTGGCDLGAPLLVTRCQAGTPSDGELKVGDKIRKIGDYDSRDLRHKDAQNLFKNAGNSIKLVVQRDSLATPAASGRTSRASSVGPSALPSALPSAPHESYPPYIMAPLNSALLDTPHTHHPRPFSGLSSPHLQEVQEEQYTVTEQPYRTTPLVLPGAKVKKDAPPTESYLRHHPNPAMRASPHHQLYLPHDVLMKQKVADSVIQKVVGEDAAAKQVVHKQFNSPIGLYSDQNIKDTIHSQTGVTPSNLKKTVVYDPAKSETYKALKEDELGDVIQEVSVPVQPKVFSPTKAVNPKLNSLGVSNEEIQQSNSFKRLMFMVMNDE
ncbi:PDZ and LIM domain protein Zasp-like isoform X5 [Nilaparvata lugens]|uniref:PDZ and LIM domain protein Zasp-like isoform X5 n=1 Tax=Nilaparvata lugens TaxID=108931 RepID=UPI00193E536B|nr:PDZ and LIM domain protein Zasp-like isoform X5 [Nilaparvata lugens]